MNYSEVDGGKAAETLGIGLPPRVPRLASLETLYAPETLTCQRARYKNLAREFFARFPPTSKSPPLWFFSAPGRTELCGNHTDHNLGNVVAAAIDLDTVAAVSPRTDSLVHIVSDGYEAFELDLADLSPRREEEGLSIAIVRGMAAGLAARGLAASRAEPRRAAPSHATPRRSTPLRGFDALVQSNVPSGSGLSSSASFEVLIGGIIALLSGIEISPAEIAAIGQYAENAYFGKPCGLMDQMACALGNIACIDFGDPSSINVELLRFDPAEYGLSLAIVSTGGSHADLTDDYAAIPAEMKSVAAYFGKPALAGIRLDELANNAASIRRSCGDRAFLRAWHFVKETSRPAALAQAIRERDIAAYLSIVRASGDSSAKYLQNLYPPSVPEAQGLVVALALTEEFLDGQGACRVHGGGFAGTIQAYVPHRRLDAYSKLMESVFGPGVLFPLRIRPYGVVCIEIPKGALDER